MHNLGVLLLVISKKIKLWIWTLIDSNLVKMKLNCKHRKLLNKSDINWSGERFTRVGFHELNSMQESTQYISNILKHSHQKFTTPNSLETSSKPQCEK